MINDIVLKNFGPHKSLKLKDLHPNLNVIIGDTNTGKSSIFRALRLLFNNEPQGGTKLFKHKEKTDIFIQAIIDGFNISRKAKSYTIDNHKLTAFGKNVPEPVKEIISLQDINWQLQIQPHFLVLDNGGTVAKYLDPIMGSEECDLILAEIKKQSVDFRSDIKALSKVIEENKKIVDSLSSIPGFKKRINKLQSYIHHLQGLEKPIFLVTEKINLISELDSKIINPKEINSFIKRLDDIWELVTEVSNVESKVSKIESKINRLKSLKHIPVKAHIEVLEEIEAKCIKKSALQMRIDKLQSWFNSYETINEALEEGLEKQKKLEKKWKKHFSSLEYCPLCNQRIVDDGTTKHAESHLHNRLSHIGKKPNLQVR